MSLEPEGRQLELLRAVIEAAASRPPSSRPPVIVVLVHGRPMSFQGAAPPKGADVGGAALVGANAVLAAWRPGEEGGSAIANLLTGDANPSGRLAQAWQRSSGYIHSPTSPWFQPHSSMAGGLYFGNGDDTPLRPLFPFGWGLSYSRFNYSNMAARPPPLPRGMLNGSALADTTVGISLRLTRHHCLGQHYWANTA